MSFCSQKAVRVTTLMKRLRASEQGDSAGAAADPSTPSGVPAPPGGSGDAAAASMMQTAPDAQTTTLSAASGAVQWRSAPTAPETGGVGLS